MALMTLALALPIFGKTYKNIDPVPSSVVWDAVKDTLGKPKNYSVVESNDTNMTASYNMKHSVQVDVTGAVLQRTNKVTLVSKGKGC